MSEYVEYQKPINVVRNPWRRFFARTFDLAVYGTFITAIEHLVLHIDTTGFRFAGLLEGFLACLIMIVIEPLMLSSIGTTPGKWIYGLVVRGSSGAKLTFSQAFERTINVFGSGLGCCIPIYILVRQYKCFKLCNDGERLPWDFGLSYKIKDTKIIRFLALLIGWGILYAITIQFLLIANMPVNRGNITSDEYIENCNVFMKYNNLDYGKKLMLDGTWEVNKNKSNIVFYTGSSTLPNHEITYSEGEIQKIVLDYKEDSDRYHYSLNGILPMAYSSFVGAEKSLNYHSLFSEDIISYFSTYYKDFEFEIAGIKVTNEVEIIKESQKEYFYLTLTMERVK